MDIQSLYSFLEVAKDLNITSASKRLFISQQCLSSRIKQLERYYGVQLFYRKPNFALTYAGEQLIQAASKILAIEDNIKLEFNDISQNKKGYIRVGSAPIRSVAFIPDVLPVFNEKYPNVNIILTEYGSFEEEKRLLNGKIDLHIGVVNKENPNIISKTLLKNKMYLIVSTQLLAKHVKGDISTFIERSKQGVNVPDFRKFPFILRPEPNPLTAIIKNRMEEVGVKPNIYFESNTHEILLSLCKRGMGATIVTQMFLYHMIDSGAFLSNSDINVFPILHNGHKIHIDVEASYLKSAYLPKYTRDFLQITESVFENIEKIYPY